MKKKILSALLVGAMVSSLLAGCGGSDSASTSDTRMMYPTAPARKVLIAG